MILWMFVSLFWPQFQNCYTPHKQKYHLAAYIPINKELQIALSWHRWPWFSNLCLNPHKNRCVPLKERQTMGWYKKVGLTVEPGNELQQHSDLWKAYSCLHFISALLLTVFIHLPSHSGFALLTVAGLKPCGKPLKWQVRSHISHCGFLTLAPSQI